MSSEVICSGLSRLTAKSATNASDVRRHRTQDTFSFESFLRISTNHPSPRTQTMTSPTRPVNIVSPRFSPAAAAAGFGTPASRRGAGSRGSPAGTPYSGNGTPDVRSLRVQYFGTPPLPNIPPRTATSTPRGGPSTSTEPLAFPGSGSPHHVPSISGISARRPAVIGLGIDDVPQPDPTVDVESTYEEDKVKVLRKHLVSRGERQGNNNDSDGVPSRKPSTANLALEAQADPEAFPVPYHTPGADITYVDLRFYSILALRFPF
jgi:solute carrier family 36 (proton-coupled amino acid transporter)